MHIHKNIPITGSDNKPITLDIFYLKTSEPKPVVIYAHGFKGFKDWGNFDLIASRFASAGFTFIKFNFSHNGTTPDDPENFGDLEAFGNNNFTRELTDIGMVIEWVYDNENPYADQIDKKNIFLIGHSMGGGVVILKGAEDKRITGVITWASITECKTPWASWSSEKIREWIDTGVQYVENSRTRQQMPLYYQLFEDYQANKDRLDIEEALNKYDKPLLICHGLKDEGVSVDKAYKLHEWYPKAELFLVDSDHVFGRKHPWTESTLPLPMEAVLDKTISFIQEKAND